MTPPKAPTPSTTPVTETGPDPRYWRLVDGKWVQLKGCPSCFGSGGPRKAPCPNCGGTGRVVK